VYPVIDSVRPIWQRRGSVFKVYGSRFKSEQGTGTIKLGISSLENAKQWIETRIDDTIPASWTPRGTYNVIITNSDTLSDTSQIRVLIPSITGTN
jgi:hypothetical protein